MKKIGILTFHRANNYGAVLQAYALKQELLSLNYKVQIINYLSPKIERDYSFFSGSFCWMQIFKKMAKVLFLPRIIFNRKQFQKFRESFLTDTAPILPKDIDKLNADFDVFITGSDQVFNPRITAFDKNYLLSFVKNHKKKYSYAASVALDNCTPKEKAFLQDHLRDFAVLSVREEKTSDLIKQLTDKHVLTHIDPTFLLNKTQWEKIAVAPNNPGKYILLYLMEVNPRIISFAQKLSQKTGLKIIYISAEFINRTPFKMLTPTPQEWIGYFLDATYIVTNSLHGVSFAINFNKKFFVDLIREGAPRLHNIRFNNLLDLMGLNSRLLDHIDYDYDQEINFSKINQIIGQEKSKAMKYFKQIASEN